jgi:hypothetical protein
MIIQEKGIALKRLIDRANPYIDILKIKEFPSNPTYVVNCQNSPCNSTFTSFETNLCNNEVPSMKIIGYALGFISDTDAESVMNNRNR